VPPPMATTLGPETGLKAANGSASDGRDRGTGCAGRSSGRFIARCYGNRDAMSDRPFCKDSGATAWPKSTGWEKNGSRGVLRGVIELDALVRMEGERCDDENQLRLAPYGVVAFAWGRRSAASSFSSRPSTPRTALVDGTV
jgi:hypothetical protein